MLSLEKVTQVQDWKWGPFRSWLLRRIKCGISRTPDTNTVHEAQSLVFPSSIVLLEAQLQLHRWVSPRYPDSKACRPLKDAKVRT